jgi:hypothetical protein
MESRNETMLLKMTATEKAQLKKRAEEKGISVTELIFQALKIKRRLKREAVLQSNNFINQAA